MASPFDAEFPLASVPVIMVSPPDTQDGPRDVFHTPPDESSLPSSDDQRRTPAVDVDVVQCAVNQAVDVDAGTQGFVDLGKDSELGFSEAHLSKENDAEVVPDCSRVAEGDALGEIHKSHFDDSGVLKREFSDLGELPVKKQKLPEQNIGFEQVPVDAGNQENKEEFCREISVEKKLSAEKIFEVLKLLSENNTGEAKDEDDVGGVSLLEAAKQSGMTFPRPRWWPDHLDFNNQIKD